ncbi:hypothetical protein HDU96_008754 [Phlyctochytrium bullatum]|nr:hypothetical protein HDU96_008754 [Phlyctochytrium bullatum]
MAKGDAGSSGTGKMSQPSSEQAPSHRHLLMVALPLYHVVTSSSTPSPTLSPTPPPSIRLFPQRHPKRSLLCIFILLISSARLSSILNHVQSPHRHDPQSLITEAAGRPYVESSSQPPFPNIHGYSMFAKGAEKSSHSLRATDNLVYRSHLNPSSTKGKPDVDSAPLESSAVEDSPPPGTPHQLAQGQEQVLDAADSEADGQNPKASQEGICLQSPEACVGSSLAYVPQPALSEASPFAPHGSRFLHGIASGDALPDAVIIWTKVTPPASRDALTIGSFPVRYDVALSPSGREGSSPASPPSGLGDDVVMSGLVVTGPEVDFTVKIDLQGLKPGTTYYYRFSVTSEPPTGGEPTVVLSPTGQTRTLPDPAAVPGPVGDGPMSAGSTKFAVVSCSNLPVGFFNAYANIAARSEVDFVVHLGDYMYEYKNGDYGDGSGLGRVPFPDRELVTLEDYRLRHAQYKLDPDLQALHRTKPWYVIWDDHEFVDNISGGDESVWDGPRMPAALRAYFEYLPIRETFHPHTRGKDSATISGNKAPSSAIYRSFQVGTLLDLILLDTRIEGRDMSGEPNATLVASETRTILGTEQEKWLEEELEQSKGRGARWRFLGNQVVFAPMDHWGLKINLDAWDGYPANRRRVIDFLEEKEIDNVVMLTGDIHTSLAFNVAKDPWDPTKYNPTTGEGSLLVEFVSPSVTSPSPLESINLGFLNSVAERVLLSAEPHLQYVDMSRRGYMLVSATWDRVRCEYWYPQDIRSGAGAVEEELGAVVETDAGSGRITRSERFVAKPKRGRGRPFGHPAASFGGNAEKNLKPKEGEEDEDALVGFARLRSLAMKWAFPSA